MRRFLIFAMVAVATFVVFSCSKDNVDKGNGKPDAPKMVTISTSIPEGGMVTKVNLYQDTPGKNDVKMEWEDTDYLTINEKRFDIISINGKSAHFSGPEPDAVDGKYTVSYSNLPTIAEQTQLADGDPADLGYSVTISNLSDYKDISFDPSVHGANMTQSSVLVLQAHVPSIVATNVKKVIIKSSKENAFGDNINAITVTLGTKGTAGADNLLDLYASLPAGNIDLRNTDFLVQFQVSINNEDNEYNKYTAYRAFGNDDKYIFLAGQANYLGLACDNIESYANASNASIGSSTNPYLVGDQHQMLKIDEEMTAGSTKYFKLVDDIDMTGATWTLLNSPSPYNKLIDFDGNNKTVSNFGGTMFYVFKGAIKNLTLDNPTITGGNQKGGFAQYIQGTGNVITNVDIKNVSSFEASSGNGGGLVGRINSGTSGVVSATITDCDIENVTVTCATAGGLIGRADNKIVVTNCSYSGNTVKGTSQNVGGLIGLVVDNTGCIISSCRVENATVDVSALVGDVRAGGFVGTLGEGCYVKGSTVGTSSQKVIIKAGKYDATNTKPINTGGFVGVNYGIITKDDSGNNSKAYVTVSSTNTTGNPLNLGGFAGFQRGTIEYSDAVVSMGDLQGQYIGGFCGYIVYQTGKTVITDHCTVVGDGDSNTVDIRGNHYSGGFVGVAENGAFTISNCHVLDGTVVVGQSTAGGFAGQIKSGTVEDCSAIVDMRSRGGNAGGFVGAITGGTVLRCSSAGSLSQIENTNNVFGGFAGYVNGVDITKCSSTVNITVARNYIGGLIGDLQTANTVSQCFYNGTISGPTNFKGGLIGTVAAVAAVITNCYTAGEMVGSSGTQVYGGIVGELKTGASVTNCYSTMDFSHGGRATGGIVGRACSAGWAVNSESGNTISKCIAWNPNITYDGTASASASSGAVIGYTSFKNILNNCYRRYDMAYKNSNTAVGTTCQTSMVDQIDCDGTNWAINGNRPAGGTPAGTSADAQYQAPYYGIAAASTATVSSLAQTLGWSSDVWDFTGDLPTLK